MRLSFLIFILVLFLSACGQQPGPGTGQSGPVAIAGPGALPDRAAETRAVGRTDVRDDGNRLVAGAADLAALTPLDVALAGPPQWVVAAPYQAGVLWVAVGTAGAVEAFQVVDGVATAVVITPAQLPAGTPPLLVVEGDRPFLLQPPSDVGPLTHPVLLNAAGDYAYVDTAGWLVVQQHDLKTSMPVDALPDGRLLVDEQGRILLLTAPTDRYAHGVLGDPLEASAITLVVTEPTPQVAMTIEITPPHVIEGLAPIWVDWNGDGQREIIVTRSTPDGGAQIVVYDERGNLVATGQPIGRGGRWRHQLAVAPFLGGDDLLLVDVLTPHIGGVVEFFTWQADEVVELMSQGGFTSHRISTRNLDMAVAGDFDASGMPSLLLPVQDRTELGGIKVVAGEATVAFTLPLDGALVSNLAATTFGTGQAAVGAGLGSGVLRIWQPAG